MTITSATRERLDVLMNARRLELGLSWRDVAERAGISSETLRGLRSGDRGFGIRELTAVSIAKALQWEPRSVLDILSGGDPVPVNADDRLDPDPPVCSFEDETLRSEVLRDDQKVAVVRAHRSSGHVGCSPVAQDGAQACG